MKRAETRSDDQEIWTLRARHTGQPVTCTLRASAGVWRVQVVGLGIPLAWSFTDEPRALAHARKLEHHVRTRGWQVPAAAPDLRLTS
jgi:hypothetical protein